MAYEQKKFRAQPQKPKGNLAAPTSKKIGIDDLSPELRDEIGVALVEIITQIADTVSTLQNNMLEALKPLSNHPTLDGVLLKQVSIRNAGTDVSHGLGRAWRGFIVTKFYNDDFYGVFNIKRNKTDETIIRLGHSGGGTKIFDIYVF